MQISLACKAREQGRIDNKLKKLIASLTEKVHNNYGMETLNITSTKILTDPQAIYDNLTAWFKDWYSRSDYSGQGIHSSPEWSSFYETRECYDKFMSDSTVPSDIQDLLWKSLRSKDKILTPALKAKLDKDLNTPPNLIQFTERIRKARGGMTGGMSGLTYNIMSKWPDSTIELIHTALCILMKAEDYPDFWKLKWLVPIPKVDMNVGRGDLRPLMLIEVLR